MNMFADPNAQQLTKLAYDAFLRHDNSRFNIRDSVKKSWQRSKAQQVSPDADGARDVVDGERLDNLRWQNKLLLQAAMPVLNQASNQLSLSSSMAALTDAQGHILRTDGSDETLKAAERIALIEGATWDEAHCGTNGIGTALSAGGPIQIYADEHYCEGIKQWSCSATIIHYPGHRYILGALDVSVLSKYHNKEVLLQAIRWAKLIERQVYEIEQSLYCYLQKAFFKRLDHTPRRHHALLNRFGHIIETTPDFYWQPLALNATQQTPKDYLCRHSYEPLSSYQLRLLNEGEQYGIQHVETVEHEGECIGFIIMVDDAIAVDNTTALTNKTNPKKRDSAVSPSAFDDIIGSRGSLRVICHQIERVAPSWSPALVSGETGTGKELFARALHAMGPTKDGAFIALNCGAFSRELFSSELFGYKEGAFTGARKGGMMGKIEAAHNGTLFLDEIGEMPLELQPQLLRVLGRGEFYCLGENQVRVSKFRLIAATNRDLHEEVAQGRFRSDLFYRLSVCHLILPPLRERGMDIERLIEHFLQELAKQYGRTFNMSAALKTQLLQAPWHGNVRELLNVLEYMVLLSDTDTLDESLLPQYMQTAVYPEENSVATPTKTALAQSEEVCIRQSISKYEGNLTKVATDLGIAKSTLYAKIKRYALQEFVEQIRQQR